MWQGIWDVEMQTTARSSLLGCHFWKIGRRIRASCHRRKEQERIAKYFAQLLGKRQHKVLEEGAGVKDGREFVFSFEKESALKDGDTEACRIESMQRTVAEELTVNSQR